METYTKINTLYKRFQHLNSKDCPDIPNENWRKMANRIIKGDFSDPEIEYLYNCPFDGYVKIDGTNSKIAFYPSTGEVHVGGKTDKASSQHGQFEFLLNIAYKIQPALKEMFPPESAKYAIVKNDKNQVKFVNSMVDTTEIVPTMEGVYNVQLEEVPIYIYGEYFGAGIQKGGADYVADKKSNRFAVFDVEQQGWWLPNDKREDFLNKIKELSGFEFETAPYFGRGTIAEFEKAVTKGFKTYVKNVSNPDKIEEGIVARPVVPLKSSRGNRIIVKIKFHDYNDFVEGVKSIGGEEEYQKFLDWYRTWEAKFPELFGAK